MSFFVLKINILLVGSLLIACGVNFFLIPFKVLDGGIIGLALILKYTLGIQVGFSILICSAPIFLFAWFQFRPLFLNSIYGLLLSTFFIHVLEPLQYHFLYYIELPAMISAIIGGAAIGAGIGIMLRFETSTGGTDLIAQFISKFTMWNVGVIIMIIDLMIITMGGFFISMETFLLSLVTISVGGIVTSVTVGD